MPDAFFKVILCRKGSPKAIGFVYDNVGKKMNLSDHVYNIDDIEEMTGIDFFPALDDNTEDTIEAVYNLEAW